MESYSSKSTVPYLTYMEESFNSLIQNFAEDGTEIELKDTCYNTVFLKSENGHKILYIRINVPRNLNTCRHE